MKRLITIALVVFSLAAVPAAFADDTTAPAAPTAPGQQQATDGPSNRAGHLRLRLRIGVHRFRKHCSGGPADSPEKCSDVAKRVAERLAKLDSKVQERIAKIQETCTATSTDERCKNADRRVERLQKIDERIKAVEQKVQDWLNGTAASGSSTGTSDSSLDQAANNLSQLVGANG